MRMQLGPTRFEVSPRKLAAVQPLEHRLFVRETSFELEDNDADLSITEIYGRLHRDGVRNAAILEDIIGTLVEGRNPIVLTQRREHLEWFAERVRPYARNVAVLKGGMGKQAEQEARETLAAATADGSTVLVATGPYVGEGFDDPRLDTLFLVMPIAWKGTLAQYVGRLHRLHPGKKEVRVFDYVDRAVPKLRRMFEKRLRSLKCRRGSSFCPSSGRRIGTGSKTKGENPFMFGKPWRRSREGWSTTVARSAPPRPPAVRVDPRRPLRWRAGER